MPTIRDERMASILKTAASLFVQGFSRPGIIITVTNIKLSEDAKNATIFFTVFPEHNENEVLKNLKNNAWEFRDVVMKKYKIGSPPLFDFKIDMGEKNRQKIDELINKS